MTDNDRLFRIRKFTLDKLKEFEGRDWKEVRGELHIGNKAIPNWILLFEDSDLKLAHSRFLEVVGPYLDTLDGSTSLFLFRNIRVASSGMLTIY